jgi:hypothetical protein
MSYRLITKATFTLANNERTADIRAYAAPKGAVQGEITLNGESTGFKLTGGQGRGTVVRCYAYFPYNGESAYIEITKDEMTELKAGNRANLVTEAKPIATPEAPETSEVAEAPKAIRVRKAKVAA